MLHFGPVPMLVFGFIDSFRFGNNLINLNLSLFSFKTKPKQFNMIRHGIKLMNGGIKIDKNNVFVPFQSLNNFLRVF